ncbi:MAG: hypothetical protein U9R15_04795 [Chloroflexota bacterium]|nr:hypothetical protein [Chloroflexota bacterium]
MAHYQADTGVKVNLTDENQLALHCSGTVAFTTLTGANLYQAGCTYVDTDIAAGTAKTYLNKGSAAAPAFTLVTQA